jgi:putative membrane protein insertion efficiency factor
MARRSALVIVAPVSATPAPRLGARIALALIALYRGALSPHLGGACRHVPSCSHYAEDAVRQHGAARGLALLFRRLLRCHPFGTSGYDPVP